MKNTFARTLMSGAVAGGILFSGTASAIDWNVTGFVRQEIAYSIASQENPNNFGGNPMNNRINTHITHPTFGSGNNANAPTSVYVDARGNRGGVFAAGLAALPAGANTSQAVDCHFSHERKVAGATGAFGRRHLAGTNPGVIFPGIGFAGACPGAGNTDYIPDNLLPNDQGKSEDINFNTFNSRMEIDVQAKFNREFSAYMKFRAYFDATRNFTDSRIGDHYGGTAFLGDRRGTYTEVSGSDYILDIPALYLDWNRGPLWIRLGNQVIAWGEAYFFRTMDVANGLDLRRHLTLGPGAEEYQDQRIASPGIRVSYTFDNGWELDAFAQMFSPTVLPGQNSPYNLIPTAGARLKEDSGLDDAENAINYGMRITMPFGESDFTGILGWVNRRNPDGVFRSVDAQPFWAGNVNTGCANQHNDTLNVLGGALGFGNTVGQINTGLAGFGNGLDPFPTLDTRARNMENGCGSPFSPDPTGTPSLQYWKAMQTGRLDHSEYLTKVINQWPAAEWAVRDIFGFGNEQSFADTFRTIEAFRSTYGPYIQWVGREFKRENIFMVGGNYIITMDDPNSIFDQMIIRGEVAVTPNKRLTNDLALDYTKVDDVVSALILEKYHRISDAFPATYFVAQWMHRTSTDLFGRDLDNNDTPDIGKFIDPITGEFTAAALDPAAAAPRGTSNANYVVFAFQQPFPNLIWRFDMSVLVDVAGGYLVQPGLRYRPSADWQWDLYATIIESPGADNDTITETLDWADEFFVRLTYFF